MFLYSGVSITYGTIRVPIITHVPWSIFLFVAWNGLGLVASMLIAFSVILKYVLLLSGMWGRVFGKKGIIMQGTVGELITFILFLDHL
jgi:hypothetical protein